MQRQALANQPLSLTGLDLAILLANKRLYTGQLPRSQYE
jgi:hypothetical protein